MSLSKLLACFILLCVAGLFLGFGGALGFLIKLVGVLLLIYAIGWLIIGGALIVLFRWLVKTLTGNGTI